MAYTFSTIQTQVRALVGDTSASVTQQIDDAVNLLSNFFQLEKVGTGTFTVDQAYITKPTNALEIIRLKDTADEKEYKKADIPSLKNADYYETRTFRLANDQVRVTPTPSAANAYEIWYRAGFTPMAGSGSTDVPDRYVPLLILLAGWLYFVGVASKAAVSRENYPDSTITEAKEAADAIKKQFDSMVDSIKGLH